MTVVRVSQSRGMSALQATFADDLALIRLGRRLALLSVILLLVSLVYYAYDRYYISAESPLDGAVRSLEDKVRAAPNDVDLRMQVAGGYLQQKRYEQAIAQYEEVLKLRNDWMPAIFAEASAEYTRGNQARSEELFHRIADSYSTNQFRYATKELQIVYYRLGELALKDRRLDEAATWSAEALRVDSANSDALYLLAQSEEARGNAAAAKDAFLGAAGFDPNFRDAYAGLERTATTTGDNSLAAYAHGMQQYAAGDFQAMLATFQGLVANAPEFSRGYEGLGLAYAKQNKADQAIAAFRSALERDPKLMLSRWSLHSLGEED